MTFGLRTVKLLLPQSERFRSAPQTALSDESAGVIYTGYLAFSGLSLGWRGSGILDAVEAFASGYGENMAPFPAPMGRTFPQGTASLLKKFPFFLLVVWAWRPGALKPFFLREWGFVRPMSISSCAVKKKWTKEETAATLCVRFEILHSAGSLKLVLRPSNSQAPDSAE